MDSVHYWPFFHNPTPSLISGFENTTEYNPDLALSENRVPLKCDAGLSSLFLLTSLTRLYPLLVFQTNPFGGFLNGGSPIAGRFITCIPWNKPQKHGLFGMIWGYPQPLGTRHLTSKQHETSSGWWF